MNIIGIGTDLCECDRIAGMIERHGVSFLEKVFTPTEIGYCSMHRAQEQHFTGRWAAKEAILKALGTGWSRGIHWTDLEIVNEAGGEPRVFLRNRAAEVAAERGIDQVLISISHTAGQAIAFAVATGVSGGA